MNEFNFYSTLPLRDQGGMQQLIKTYKNIVKTH